MTGMPRPSAVARENALAMDRSYRPRGSKSSKQTFDGETSHCGSFESFSVGSSGYGAPIDVGRRTQAARAAECGGC